VTGERLRRAPVRACLALLLALPFVVTLLGASTGVAHSATAGTLVVAPATGSALTVSTFVTSGVCPAGDTVRLKVFGGSGAGATIAAPATINSPKNLNGAVDASSVTVGSGMEISASLTWSDFATGGTPVLSRLNGTYTLRAWCSSDAWFDGTITFTGTDTTTSTYTSATPSPTPTSVSPSPTTASPSPTTASPTTTSASPTATSASPSPTSPSPTTTSASPTPTTTSPTPTPTVPAPGGPETGQAVDAQGAFIAPGAPVQRGTIVTMVGHGFAPGELLTFSLLSPGMVYGKANADSNGSAVYQFALPLDLPLGAHRLQMTGATHAVVFPFLAADSTATPTPTTSATSTSGTSGGSGGGTSVSAPGASASTLADTGSSPAVFTTALATALLLAVGANLVVGQGTTTSGAGRHAGAPAPGGPSARRPGTARPPTRTRTSRRTKGRHA